MNRVITVYDVITSANELTWSDALYLKHGNELELSTPAIVWDPDDVENDLLDTPAFPAERGMSYATSISTLQDVISNAKQQMPTCNTELLLEALKCYLKNDAFIDWSQSVVSPRKLP